MAVELIEETLTRSIIGGFFEVYARPSSIACSIVFTGRSSRRSERSEMNHPAILSQRASGDFR